MLCKAQKIINLTFICFNDTAFWLVCIVCFKYDHISIPQISLNGSISINLIHNYKSTILPPNTGLCLPICGKGEPWYKNEINDNKMSC